MNDTVLSLLAGACYSAAYIAPKPLCFYYLIASTVLVIVMRGF